MPSFLGWDIVFIPAYPPAPASIEFTQVNAAALNVSPFTGQQQVQDWNATWMKASVSMPPMRQSDAENWVDFLRNLKGVVKVFQFSAAFAAAYPEIGSRYWRLESNTRKWSVNQTRLYGLQFDVVEAL